MVVYNVGFVNNEGKIDETQLDVEEHNREDDEIVELINLILSLNDEMGIEEVKYIEVVEE